MSPPSVDCPIRSAFLAVEPLLAGRAEGSLAELMVSAPFDRAAELVVARGATDAYFARHFDRDAGSLESALRACLAFVHSWGDVISDSCDDEEAASAVSGAEIALNVALSGPVLVAYSAGLSAAAGWRDGSARGSWPRGAFPGGAALAAASGFGEPSLVAAFLSGFLAGFPGGRVVVDAVSGAVVG